MAIRLAQPASRWGTHAALVSLALCLLAVGTRVPFRSEVLHHWDSVNFALALEKYDVRLHQPHPPGTFVIYIMLGRLVNAFLHDPNASLVWLSVWFSAFGIVLLYWLGRLWFDHRVGLTAALLAMTSPLVWFHGEVALSYALEFFWVPLTVLFCFQLEQRRWRPLLISALLIGLSGGVRPNTPFFLFPLWLGGALLHRHGARRILVGLLVMAGGAVLWIVPMLILSGGLQEYLKVMRWWQNQHMAESASVMGLAKNLFRLGVYTLAALALGLVPLGAAVPRFVVRGWRVLATDWRAQGLALWILPGAAYYVVVHVHQSGHVFTIVPALLLLTALAMTQAARRGQVFRRGFWIALTAVVVLGNALIFLFTPAYPLGDRRLLLTAHSWPAIQHYDAYITSRVRAIRASTDPQDTAILAGGRDFRIPDFYLPDYQHTDLSYRVHSRNVDLAWPVRKLVIFDEEPDVHISPELTVSRIALPNGEAMLCVEWDADQVAVVGEHRITLRRST